MNSSRFMTINAFVLLALGIAFLLYSPNAMSFFQITSLSGGSSQWFWNVVSFGRMFGAALFGLGLLTWAVKDLPDHPALAPEIGRGILMALIISNLALTIAALTQQVSVWLSLAGWITGALFTVFTLGYVYLIWRRFQK